VDLASPGYNPARGHMHASQWEELSPTSSSNSSKYHSTLAGLKAYIFAHREACTSDPGERGG
jgi:hypothetical protein